MQHLTLGFELTTSRFRVSSLNHKTSTIIEGI